MKTPDKLLSVSQSDVSLNVHKVAEKFASRKRQGIANRFLCWAGGRAAKDEFERSFATVKNKRIRAVSS